MGKALGTLGGAVLLTSLWIAPAMASLWRGDIACNLDLDGTFGHPSSPRPYAVIQGRGEGFISIIQGLPPDMDFTCVVDCFLEGGTELFPCGRSDANGRLRAQRPEGFRLPPGVCAGIDFFLFDTATGGDGVVCVGASAAP